MPQKPKCTTVAPCRLISRELRQFRVIASWLSITLRCGKTKMIASASWPAFALSIWQAWRSLTVTTSALLPSWRSISPMENLVPLALCKDTRSAKPATSKFSTWSQSCHLSPQHLTTARLLITYLSISCFCSNMRCRKRQSNKTSLLKEIRCSLCTLLRTL